ncbi:hypothetical protein [Mycobacterium sp. M26]|nr:hypothetical protein [Mycobacterium sp. M26]
MATNPPTAAAGFKADDTALRARRGRGVAGAACFILTSDRGGVAQRV